jgi:hypothetical protein
MDVVHPRCAGIDISKKDVKTHLSRLRFPAPATVETEHVNLNRPGESGDFVCCELGQLAS